MIQVELESPLALNECAARLAQVTYDLGSRSVLGTLYSSEPLVGRLSGRSVEVCRHRLPQKYVARLVGRLSESNEGTVFRGDVGLRMKDLFFMAGSVGFLVLWVCLVSYEAICSIFGIETGRKGPSDSPFVLPLMSLAGLLMLAVCVYSIRRALRIARQDERFLIAFVAETIDSPSVPELLAAVRAESLRTPRAPW